MKDSFEMNEVIIDFFSGRVFSIINNYFKLTFTLKQVEARVNICFALLLGWTFQEKQINGIFGNGNWFFVFQLRVQTQMFLLLNAFLEIEPKQKRGKIWNVTVSLFWWWSTFKKFVFFCTNKFGHKLHNNTDNVLILYWRSAYDN